MFGCGIGLRRSTIRVAAFALMITAAAVDAQVAEPNAKPTSDRKPDPSAGVTFNRGNLPVIISAPHGGRSGIDGVMERQGIGVRLFRNRSDFNTDQLAERLAESLELKLGKRPYLIVARFHRRYIDANRPASLAYESQAAKETYDAYHQALSKARSEVIERWGRGVLLDIHGQAAEPTAIFRGTQNGSTTSHLAMRFGDDSWRGQSSLFGRLAAEGFRVIPPIGSEEAEHGSYDGGHIVVSYGSGRSGTLDAIQLELGRELRESDTIESTAVRIANAIIEFGAEYLPTRERTPVSVDGKSLNVGVYVDKGTGRSLKSVIRSVESFDNMVVTRLSADDIRSGRLKDVDVLIQPGGSGSGQAKQLTEAGREAIRTYVRQGGGYIGICGGAYLASSHYKWSLDILDAKVLDTRHWARGHGMVQIGITESGQKFLKTKEDELTIQYWQGPLLAPGNDPEIDDYDVVATFETEIAENGAPKGVMRGSTAIARGTFGDGRVVCFSPHPELTEGQEVLIRYAIDEVRRQR